MTAAIAQTVRAEAERRASAGWFLLGVTDEIYQKCVASGTFLSHDGVLWSPTPRGSVKIFPGPDTPPITEPSRGRRR